MSSTNKEIFFTEELPIEIDFSDADKRSAEEKLSKIEDVTQNIQAEVKAQNNESEIRLKGLQAYYGMRDRWSWILASLLIASIIFQFTLVLIVGIKWLDFTKNKDFLLLVTGENFVQIIGLCIIIVNFLFPKTKEK